MDNTLSGVGAFRPTSLDSLADFSMGKIVGRKAGRLFVLHCFVVKFTDDTREGPTGLSLGHCCTSFKGIGSWTINVKTNVLSTFFREDPKA